MKVLLDIQEEKAEAFMEVLESINFVKVKKVKSKKERFLRELKEAVEELNLIKAGKKQARDADEFFKELQGKND